MHHKIYFDLTQQNDFPFSNTILVRHLAACFNNTSATYKFYWLLAILDGIQGGQRELDKHKLFISMISNAWHTVNYFNVSFGPQDLIQETVRQIKDIEGITIDLPFQLSTVYFPILLHTVQTHPLPHWNSY